MSRDIPTIHELKMIDYCRFIFLRGVKLGFTLGKGDKNDPIFDALSKLHSKEFMDSLKSEATRDHLSEANGIIFDHDLNDTCLATIRQVINQESSAAEQAAYEDAVQKYLNRIAEADKTAKEKGF